MFFVKNVNCFDFLELTTLMGHYENLFGAKFLWTPKETKEMFLTSCLLFPEHFTLNHQIFVLPSEKTDAEMEKVSARFKDLLDYNNYVTIGQIKRIQTAKF